MSGLSIANNLLSGRVQLNLNRNQAALQQAVTSLSSGLRINSAADDPSGLAISTNLQTQVDAFNTASQNVQNANNAAQVADGALATETDILQRIRNLAVEASSSINSSSDTANLQSEVSQLLLEVNRISQSVTFNGQPLLDGSHAGFQPYTSASYSITNNAVLANSGSTSALVPDGDFAQPPLAANAGAFPQLPTGWSLKAGSVNNAGMYNGNDPANQPLPAGVQGVLLQTQTGIEQTLTGLSAGATYTITLDAADNTLGPGGTLQVLANGADVTPLNAGSVNASGFTSLTSQTFTANASGQVVLDIYNSSALGNLNIAQVSLQGNAPANSGDLVSGVTQVTTTGGGFITSGSTVFDTTNSGAVDGTIELQVVNTNSTSVGVEVQFFSSAAGAAATPVIYAANAAADSLVSVDGLNISIGNVSLADAGTTSYIKVSQATAASSSSSGPFTIQSGSAEGDTVQIGIQATNAQTLRISNINIANTNAPVLAAEDAIGQIDSALQTLLNQRAQLGAVIVRLNEDAANNSVAAVNLQASESSIRDLNVGEATTSFTKLQVLVQVGTSVLAQSNANEQSVLGLFR